MGIFTGFTLTPPSKHNPKGYFEDVEFSHLLNTVANGDCYFEGFVQELVKLIERRYNLHKPWGFKSPVIANFLELFKKFFPEGKFIFVHRNKDAIKRSFNRMGWTGFDPVYQLRIKHMKEYRPKHTLDIQFEKLTSNRGVEVKRIADFIGKSVTQEAIDYVEIRKNGEKNET